MRLVEPSFEILTEIEPAIMLTNIERAGRTCYKSVQSVTSESSLAFIKSLIKNGHESVLEHEAISVRIICDRGVSHEIVRHRLASYSQESTRYCNYAKDKFDNEISVIAPKWLYLSNNTNHLSTWKRAMLEAEEAYMTMVNSGVPAQIARSVLPNALKTEIVMTANLREWRHFFKLRTSPKAHPQMREITIPMLKRFKNLILGVFDDIDPSSA